MTDIPERALRDALQLRAAQLDPTMAARLLAVDYRPQRRRGRLGPVLNTLGLSAVVAALVGMAVLGSSTTAAFAGWVPKPSHLAMAQLGTILQKCGLGSPVLTDTRGPYTAAVYATPNGAGSCVQGGSVSFSGTISGASEGTAAPGQIQTFVLNSTDSSGHAFTVLDGRVGTGVTAVTIERTNGIAVTATVSNGWYLAWWPASAHATRARVTTTAGAYTTELPAAATQPPSCGRANGCTSLSFHLQAFAPGRSIRGHGVASTGNGATESHGHVISPGPALPLTGQHP